ncbi:hypothetical protein SAMN04487957_102219 [Halomonas shengliensis]|uniref:Uncharacterized protein n=1 Tax=Halomonas shengliensis TaxID=419597 RepID=A0A1H0EW81_9GAMM|nr:hypothetical protein [Halomonas shengliensis]SDN86644.1 hypothetical protein SAMN04487957_102219 [Halomonas shengliensis]
MPSNETITAHELLYDLVPKLKATEATVSDTLTARLMMTTDPEVRERLKTFKAEFELERTMIRMNLEHLLRRHAEAVEAERSGNAGESRHTLPLDEHEATAVARVRQLYRRAQELKR